MKTIMLLGLLLLASALIAGESTPQHLIIGHSGYLPPEAREDCARRVVALLLERPPGSRVTLLDGSRLQTEADARVPEGSLRLRQERLLPDITRMVKAIRGATNSMAAFNVPRLLDYLAREVRTGSERTSIILIGPALYRNPQEPTFDMTRHWPSDGHLVAGFERSIFSTVERAHRLDGISLAWGVIDTSDPISDTHHAAILRFWALFVGTQGGTLTSFSPDLTRVFANALETGRRPICPLDLDSKDTEVVMRSRHPEVQREEKKPIAVTNAPPSQAAPTPTNAPVPAPPAPRLDVRLPQVAPQNTGLGIVWVNDGSGSNPADLDLYVLPSTGAELYFGRTTTDTGRYYRDVRQSLPASGDWRASWEFVELTGETLPKEVWVNLFSGRGPVKGELRLQYKGKVHTVGFALPQADGDASAGKDRRTTSPAWVRIKLTGESN